jgi:predicted RND superfamily exporter protein
MMGLKLLGGAIIGLIAATLFLVIVGVIVNAQEATPTRPATSGEQNRTLNYRQPERIIVESERVTDYVIISIKDCSPTNRELLAMLQDIAKRIAQRPQNGHYYTNTILAINRSWCI